MPAWKKIIVSGSQAHLQGITASNLTNNTGTPTPQIVGYNPATGIFSYFNTSSIASPTTIDGVGVGQRLTMWSDNNTITTSSIVMTTDANPRYIVGHTDTATSPAGFAGRLNVSGSSGNEGIIVGHRVSSNIDSYAVHTFVDNEGPKIGFGSYTTGTTTTPLSASWGQIGAYNQALRFEAFTTGSHVLSGGILFSYSGSNRPDLKISASNGATLVGINTANPTNTLQVGGGITAVNITASGNISSSAGLIGQTLTTSGNSTIGGNETITGNLSVDGNTTLGNAAADTASINTGRVNIPNLTAGSSELAVLVTGSGGQVFTRAIDNRVFGTTLISGSGTPNQIAYFNATTGIAGDTALTYDALSDVLTINSSTFGNDVTIAGNLTVNGDTTIINTSTLSVEDKFIILGRSSGSQVPASEGGIIIEGAGGSGSAFVFNSGSGGANGLANRWGVALGVGTASINVTPTDFMVTVSSSGASPTDSNPPTFGSSSFGYGNMHINTTDGEIWIYV